MGDKIRVIIKEPGKPAYEKEIDNDLRSLQKIVGGYIETVTLCEDLTIICNEEGRIDGLPYNCDIMGVSFVGTIIIAGIDGCEFADAPRLERLRKIMLGLA